MRTAKTASVTKWCAQCERRWRGLSGDDSTGEIAYKRVVRLFRGHTDRVVHLKIAKSSAVQRCPARTR